jgi:hypothetical protein
MTLIALFLVVFIVSNSCNRSNYNFSKKDLRFVQSYDKIDTIIYFSKLEKRDTIIFNPVKEEKVNPKSFPLGFENTFYLIVSYRLTNGSYHKLVSGIDALNSNNLITFSVTPPTTDFKHIYFIGSLFYIEKLEKLNNENVETIDFFDKDAKDIIGFALNKWVSTFRLSFKDGILSYEDNDGTKWERFTKQK